MKNGFLVDAGSSSTLGQTDLLLSKRGFPMDTDTVLLLSLFVLTLLCDDAKLKQIKY